MDFDKFNEGYQDTFFDVYAIYRRRTAGRASLKLDRVITEILRSTGYIVAEQMRDEAEAKKHTRRRLGNRAGGSGWRAAP